MRSLSRLKRSLLTDVHARPAAAVATNAVTASTAPTPTAADVLAEVKALLAEPRPRWAGGDMAGVRFEEDPTMPPGWFSLREPGSPLPYTVPLPMASFEVFYRGGDIVRLSPDTVRALASKADPRPPKDGIDANSSDGGRA